MYVTTKDIADRLGLTREYVTAKLTKSPGFPAPVEGTQKRQWLSREVSLFLSNGRHDDLHLKSAQKQKAPPSIKHLAMVSYHNARRRCRSSGRPFALTVEDMVSLLAEQRECCAVSGMPFANEPA